MKKRIVKNIMIFIILGCIIFGLIRYKTHILNMLNLCKATMGITLFYTITIIICALMLILIFWLIACSLDKRKEGIIGQPFAELHPQISLIIGILIIVVMCVFLWAIGYYLLYYISIIFLSFINWISTLASKMDAVVIVALITGVISLVGVIISSIVAKVIDYRKSRQDYLAKKREEPYGQFVDMMYKLQQNSKNGNKYTKDMMIEDISKFSKQITLWGSPRVVNKWVKFRENATNPDIETDNIFLLEEIMNEMRRDLGVKKVKKGKLLAFFINDIKEIIKGKN